MLFTLPFAALAKASAHIIDPTYKLAFFFSYELSFFAFFFREERGGREGGGCFVS